MIPIIEDIVRSCETKDLLSEIGFLGGTLVAIYGSYLIFNKQSDQSVHNGVLAVVTGGLFMTSSYMTGKSSVCEYRYQD